MKRSEINNKKILPWNDDNLITECMSNFVDHEFNIKEIIPNDSFINLKSE